HQEPRAYRRGHCGGRHRTGRAVAGHRARRARPSRQVTTTTTLSLRRSRTMNGLSIIIPIVFLGLAVTGIISAVIIKLQRLRIEEARLRAGSAGDEELAHQVVILQQEMAELQE